MELIIVLAVGAPIALGLWLIVRAVSAQNRIEELTQRVDRLQQQVLRLNQRPPAAAQAEEETSPVFKPAVLPARKTDWEPFPPVAEEPVIPGENPAHVPAAEVPPASPVPAMPVPVEPEAIAPPVIRPPITEFARTASAARSEETTAPVPPPFMPKTESEPPEPAPVGEKASFEMRLGTYWLVRVGIVMLLTGLAFFANYAYHHVVPKLGPGGKISLLYLASGLLLGAGAWWQRRNMNESLKNYAQVLFAGGLAAVYFTTYAAYHIPPLRVIENAVVDGTLLLAWAGVIMWIADRRKSEVMALFAVGLAFYSSIITRVGDFTLYSNLVLTIAAVVFLIRNRWVSLSFAGLATSYAGYAFWRFLHENGWRLAAPDERLGFGASFLAAYWLVFTTASFLSKSEKLSGKNRAAFLTLNNGAFFALFLLTMLQVHTGGFWKFSLGYGVVLLALAGLAKKMLPDEPLARNGYLTQGLLLVTLGFITKFAGLQLALVLGVESVVLFLLGVQRPSAILKGFAYAAAGLATGWFIASLQPLAARGVWAGVALGGLMAVNACRAHWLEKAPSSPRLETTVFTLLAFISWAATTWFNSAEPHLPAALVLGVESVVLFNLVARRQSLPPMIFAGFAAGFGIVWCALNQKQFEAAGLWAGAALGALMLFNAWTAHRQAGERAELPLRPTPSLFTLLAFASWLVTTWFNTSAEHLPLALTVEAVAFTLSIYWLRIREVALLGQFFLVFAQLAWLFHFLNHTPPWWNPLVLIAATVGLSHWWQWQKRVTLTGATFTCYSTVFALAAIAVVIVWLHPLVEAPTWLVLTSLLAVAATVYGVVTRAWLLAICGQIFLVLSAWEFLVELFHGKPEWYFPLAPLVVLGILSFATVAWFARQPETGAKVRGPLLQVALVYRWLALVMSLLWIWQYVPEPQRVWAFMLTAAAVFALAMWRRNQEALVAVAVYAVASLATLWLRDGLAMDIYWPNLLALLTLFAFQQMLRRTSATWPLDEKIHSALVFVAGGSLWRFVSCWAESFTSGFFVTMSWAGLAVLIFAAGILLRERFHRWLGLGVLAAAVGRVVLVDVWKQETIYRVLTFMALGVALLVIGFIYNKYQDAIRKWL